MNTVSAQVLQSFTGCAVSDDAAHIVLFAQSADATIPIAIQTSQIFRLMALLSVSASAAARKRDDAEHQQHTFLAKDVSLRAADERGGIVVDFTIPGGMSLSYLLNVAQVESLASGLTLSVPGAEGPSDSASRLHELLLGAPEQPRGAHGTPMPQAVVPPTMPASPSRTIFDRLLSRPAQPRP